MEDLPYDLSQALKESSEVVEQTVRRHNRKRRGKKRRSNPDADFDLNEVDFPNRSDASSGGGGGGGSACGSMAEKTRAEASVSAMTTPAVSTYSRCHSAVAAGASTVVDLLHHGSSMGRMAATARSDSDDVHIAARLSALTLPPTAALLPITAAMAARSTGGAHGATSGGAVIKDLESDSVNEKSPVRRLNQRRRRRLRHMLVDEVDASGAQVPVLPGAVSSKMPVAVALHGRRAADFTTAVCTARGGSNTLNSASTNRHLWKRKRKQKMDVSSSSVTDHVAGHVPSSKLEDDEMQDNLLSSDLSSTSEDEGSAVAWRYHRGSAVYDDAQEGDDEQSDFFHEPGSTYGIPPLGVHVYADETKQSLHRHHHQAASAAAAAAASQQLRWGTVPWWEKENESVADIDPVGGGYFGYRTHHKDGNTSHASGDDQHTKEKLHGKNERPIRIGRRRLKSASYRPHDELYAVGGATSSSTTRACTVLLSPPQQLTQPSPHSSDVKRRRKTGLSGVAADEPVMATSRSVLIPHHGTVGNVSSRNSDGATHASL